MWYLILHTPSKIIFFVELSMLVVVMSRDVALLRAGAGVFTWCCDRLPLYMSWHASRFSLRHTRTIGECSAFLPSRSSGVRQVNVKQQPDLRDLVTVSVEEG